MKSIDWSENSNTNFIKTLFNLSTNVRSIRLNNFSLITSKPNNNFSKLEEFIIFNNKLKSNELESFADNYCEKINKLELSFNDDNNYEMCIHLNKDLTQLSHFENLNNLSLDMTSIENELFGKGLEMIANKCKKLQKLDSFIECETTIV